MRGRWAVTSPLLILAAIGVSALPPPVAWGAAGLAVAAAGLLAMTRLLRRRPDGAEAGRREPGTS